MLCFCPFSHVVASLLPLHFLQQQSLIFDRVPSAFMAHFTTSPLMVPPGSPPPIFLLPMTTTHSSLTLVTPFLIPPNVPTVAANSFSLGSSSSLLSPPPLLIMINVGSYFSSLMVRNTYHALNLQYLNVLAIHNL